MLRNHNAKTLQILVFDSPILSIQTSGEVEEASDSVNTFISITLYDENEKEIPIKNINKELETEGVEIDEAYEYKGQKYIKCTSNHLTAFTAGTYNFNSNASGLSVLLIAFGILLAFIGFLIVFFIIKKRTKSTFRFNPANSKLKQSTELQTF